MTKRAARRGVPASAAPEHETMRPRTSTSWRAELLPVAAVAAAFVAGAALSWRRLGSLVVDTGRELELPLRLVQGEVLYRDVRYFWGPLAPTVNAALYRAFGASIDTLMWAGIVVAALVTACLYLLARAFLSRGASAAVAVAFVFASAFAHQGPIAVFEFVLPFNFSATYGLAAAAWSLLLLLWHLRSRRLAPFVGSVALAALACFTKAEVILPVLATHVAFAAAVRPLGRARAVAYAVGGAVVALGYGGVFAVAGPGLWDENLALLANPSSRHYVRVTTGLDALAPSLADLVASASLLAVLVGMAVVVARVLRRRGGAFVRAAAALAAGGACLAAFALYPPQLSLRALPLALAAGLLALLVRLLARRRRPTPAETGRILLLTFGLACLPRIALQVGPHGYGFYLLPVGLVGLGVVVRGCRRLAGGGPVARGVLASAFAGAMLGLALAALRGSWPYYTEPRIVLDTPRGEVRLRGGWRSPADVLRALMSLPPSTRVAALPDGAGLVFASGLTSIRDPILTYAPMVLPDAAAEARALEAWERDPPDVVVWENEHTERVFGFRGFGVDYARGLREWLEAHYVPLGDPSQPYVLLRRAR